MGKIAHLDISETLTELKRLLSRQKTLKGEKRVKSLIYIKMNPLCINNRIEKLFIGSLKSYIYLNIKQLNIRITLK